MVDPRWLADKIEIADLCNRYAVALDARDWDLLRSCFTADAVGHYGAATSFVGYDQIEQLCRANLAPLSSSQHLVGTVLVDVGVGADEARCTCYLQAQHVRAGLAGGEQFVFAGRYTDRLIRTDAGWRIVERRLDPMWTSGNPAVLAAG